MTVESSKPAPLSVKLGRPRKLETNEDKPNERSHNLRTIKKKAEVVRNKRKMKRNVQDMQKRASPRKQKPVENLKKVNVRIVSKNDMRVEPKPRGRPRKNPGAPKMSYKQRVTSDKKRS